MASMSICAMQYFLHSNITSRSGESIWVYLGQAWFMEDSLHRGKILDCQSLRIHFQERFPNLGNQSVGPQCPRRHGENLVAIVNAILL